VILVSWFKIIPTHSVEEMGFRSINIFSSVWFEDKFEAYPQRFGPQGLIRIEGLFVSARQLPSRDAERSRSDDAFLIESGATLAASTGAGIWVAAGPKFDCKTGWVADPTTGCVGCPGAPSNPLDGSVDEPEADWLPVCLNNVPIAAAIGAIADFMSTGGAAGALVAGVANDGAVAGRGANPVLGDALSCFSGWSDTFA
jgi:hypothetical protein